MKRAEKKLNLRLTPLAQALRNAGILIFAAALTPGAAMAQVPTGGVVTQGNATITNVSPTQQRITQTSDKAVINWQSFSIGAPNSVVFAQPGAGSVVLNRVVGGNESVILGRMSANGQVFLVNPNGVYFGPNAVVDVTGIVATTLNIRDSDFMAGRYVFSRDPSSPARATVINDGVIRANPGGYVVLAGDYAANNGIVEARLGTALLAAAGKITLDITGDNLINYAIAEQTFAQLAGVANAGQIAADGGRVVMTASVARDLSATVVNNTGVVQARGTTERDGAIYLTADGGNVASSGRLDASGARGGQIVAQAASGTTLVSGIVDASGSTSTGGNVQLLGERVGLIDNARVDASGQTGGGTVLVGGDFQGKNAAVQNAQRTYVGPDAQINADARASGNGGKVIVWSDDITRYYGSISARGGTQSGNGGFAEVSGHRLLNFNGAVDLTAPKGAAGTLLLDPLNITLSTAAASVLTGFAPPGDQTYAFADDAALTSNLNVGAGGSFAAVGNNTTIVLQASNDITVSNAFNLATATGQTNVSLNLQANNNITLTAGIAAAGTGTLSLTADANSNGSGSISGAGVLTQTSGTLSLSAGSGISVTTAAPTVSFTNTSGAISISNTAAGGLTVSGSNGGTVSVTETSGALVVGAGGIAPGANTVALTSAGAITQSGTISGTTLTTSSVGGTTLNGANTVTGFRAANTTSGNIALTNTT
ncbi:MAG: filamentous hemagglutinin N-terminal domain-containing protein, partial [Rhodocyclales bacterium]|nr:filamentous hemagglutinin N-terminal domain-containing protein [Rhodocyclales bacterium]